ncbi:MAG: SET domain-containing protein [Phycisphaeraceae bacterium]|nr:SET domain-containing protein [Phycisphaeraceae bacterium]MCB9847525.1 SET domain-containing protein [Phycisphaeraceae bacterium]
MMHPDTALRFISDAIGHGVVATRDIPAGTITWAQDKLDREFTPDEVESMGDPYREILDTYCFRNPFGRWVLCWDHARFVNHSFRSNCITTAYNFEIAVRDIKAGEELTDDYGYLNICQPFRPIDEGCDRTVVHPDDLTRYHPVWDDALRQVWPRIPKVDQPLRGFLARGLWQRVGRIARGREQMASILECYYDPGASFDSGETGLVEYSNGSAAGLVGSHRRGSK